MIFCIFSFSTFHLCGEMLVKDLVDMNYAFYGIRTDRGGLAGRAIRAIARRAGLFKGRLIKVQTKLIGLSL